MISHLCKSQSTKFVKVLLRGLAPRTQNNAGHAANRTPPHPVCVCVSLSSVTVAAVTTPAVSRALLSCFVLCTDNDQQSRWASPAHEAHRLEETAINQKATQVNVCYQRLQTSSPMGAGGPRKLRVVTYLPLDDFEIFRVYNLDQIITLPRMFFKILPYYYANSKCKTAKKIYKQIFIFHYHMTQHQKHLPNFVHENLIFFILLTLTFLNIQTSLYSDTFNESSMDFSQNIMN